MKLIKNVFSFMKDYRKISNSIYKNSHVKYLSEDLVLAVVCAEDRYFFYHHGVSFKSLLRAFIKSHGGASTINMQLVRVVTGRYEVSIKRKLREILMAAIIDFNFNKMDILQAYLNCSYFGVGTIGIDDVIFKFFDKNKNVKLTFMDCCFIASMLKRPSPKDISLDWAFKINNRMCHIENTASFTGIKMRKKIKSYLQQGK